MTDVVTDTAAAVAEAGARTIEPSRVATGFSWPECPRWHDGTFWFADMYNAQLKVLDADGNASVVIDATGRRTGTDTPIALGGFGWLPDGRLIVTSMHEKLLLVHGGNGPADLSVYADVSEFASAAINDMVVDSDGHAYVTQLGFDLFKGEEPLASLLIVVDPDGKAAAADAVGPVMCANGITISADGTKVFTAEVMASQITVIDRAPDRSLSNPRKFAGCPSFRMASGWTRTAVCGLRCLAVDMLPGSPRTA